jgi:peptide/nickel transport system substrate-binding protein
VTRCKRNFRGALHCGGISVFQAGIARGPPGAGHDVQDRPPYTSPREDQVTGQAMVTIDEQKRELLLREANETGDPGIIPIHHEASTWGMRKNLSYEARTDQYMLAMDIRPR